MGPVCVSCYNSNSKEENLLQLSNNKRLSSAMTERSPIYNKIQQITQFIDGLELRSQIKEKYIIQLLEIREELQIQMAQHTDKYDGYCPTRETVQGFVFRNNRYHLSPWCDKLSLNQSSSFQWNPQDGSIDIQRTTCSKGIHLNECMEICIQNLQNLGYFERRESVPMNSSIQEEIHAAFILIH